MKAFGIFFGFDPDKGEYAALTVYRPEKGHTVVYHTANREALDKLREAVNISFKDAKTVTRSFEDIILFTFEEAMRLAEDWFNATQQWERKEALVEIAEIYFTRVRHEPFV